MCRSHLQVRVCSGAQVVMLKYVQNLFLAVLASFAAGCGGAKLLEYNDTEAFKAGFYAIDTSLIKNKELNHFLFEYKSGIDSLMGLQLGQSERPLTKAQPDCTLGYLVADALYEVGKAKDSLVQAAISNQGGIRVQYVAPGAITLGQVYEIMPFDNLLVVLEVSGATLRQWLEHIAAKGGWPVSGIRFEIEDGKAKNVTVQGKPIHDNLVYRIATSDYLAGGGDDCEFLRECKRYRYNVLMRDAIADFIRNQAAQGRKLHYELENRIMYAE